MPGVFPARASTATSYQTCHRSDVLPANQGVTRCPTERVTLAPTPQPEAEAEADMLVDVVTMVNQSAQILVTQ
jgi:hypothetical protein